ncbi:MAG: class A beta-lactamase-related serine hydrolase [Phenylobacterium sp.]|uniref:serine hydrolase domain-containing protein n=1 Tax=Phenylobacterium sp. TaxID=1871053 RepID=UPI0011FBBEF5|nr:serine hydrolase domain-containing protein [Phenylobacterium sp.]TAJ68855.1 MAG: class A beta-lactamase-related serine hydrolase [Phenylobacterium sp.]
MKRLWLRICVGLALAMSAAVARADDFATKLAAFQAALETSRQEIGFPGATAGFVLPDGRSGMVAVGVSDKATGRPMTPQDRMMSGSTGKTYVSATALALARQGRLDLDAPITRYLGHPDWMTGLPNMDRITMRQLLGHTSGLRDHVNSPTFGLTLMKLAQSDPEKALTAQQCIGFLKGQTALFEPGHGYAYSDTGYLIAGLVIEAAAKQPFYDLARRLFWDPLGLTLTAPADQRRIPGLTQGYPVWPSGAPLPDTIAVAPGRLRWNPASEWTGGGVVTNAHDAARWAAALYGGKAMLGDYLPEMLRGVPIREGSPKTYGLGVSTAPTPYGTLYGHSGYYPGYRSDLAYFPDLKIAVAFQINTETGVREAAVLDAIRNRLVAALVGPPAKP